MRARLVEQIKVLLYETYNLARAPSYSTATRRRRHDMTDDGATLFPFQKTTQVNASTSSHPSPFRSLPVREHVRLAQELRDPAGQCAGLREKKVLDKGGLAAGDLQPSRPARSARLASQPAAWPEASQPTSWLQPAPAAGVEGWTAPAASPALSTTFFSQTPDEVL